MTVGRLATAGNRGRVVTLPALPHLLVRGATSRHACVEALAPVERHLRTRQPERPSPAHNRVADRPAPPLAA